MNKISCKGEFLKSDSKVYSYMVYPRFLTKLDLNETAKLIYVLLLDRSRLSIKNGGWSDEKGNIFVLYTLKSLAEDSGRSERTISKALQDLGNADLIFLGSQDHGRGRRIYVKTVAENCDTGWKKTASEGSRKLRPNKNNRIRNIEQYTFEEGESL